jgi:hypothetical protein
MRRIGVVLVAVLALTACTDDEPEADPPRTTVASGWR